MSGRPNVSAPGSDSAKAREHRRMPLSRQRLQTRASQRGADTAESDPHSRPGRASLLMSPRSGRRRLRARPAPQRVLDERPGGGLPQRSRRRILCPLPSLPNPSCPQQRLEVHEPVDAGHSLARLGVSKQITPVFPTLSRTSRAEVPVKESEGELRTAGAIADRVANVQL